MSPSSENTITQTSFLGDKLLFSGLSEAGKSAIRDRVFSGKLAADVEGYGATLNYERQIITLDSGFHFTIFDLGGQKVFLNRYLNQFSTFVFHRVSALVFVIDVSEPTRFESAKEYFDLALTQLKKHSPTAPVFMLLNKVDLLEGVSDKETRLQHLKAFMLKDINIPFRVFHTSIYDDSLKNTFDEILNHIFPTMIDQLEPELEDLSITIHPGYSELLNADELDLIEIAKALALMEKLSKVSIKKDEVAAINTLVRAVSAIDSVGETEIPNEQGD